MSFISLSMLLIAIILPAMYSNGIHSKAVSAFLRFRVSQVMRADASIRAFSTMILFGFPVLPDVCIVKVGQLLFHSFRKSSNVIFSILSIQS